MENYVKDLSIDPDALDVEWIGQPTIYMRYAEAAADARLEMDNAKSALDIKKAEIDISIRMHPSKYVDEGKKPTEAQIFSIILIHDDYKKAEKTYFEARHKYDLFMSAVRAFEQRKNALENLRALCLGGYFSGPKELRDLSVEVANKAREDKAIKNIREGRKKQ